jgi:hypothetical protein
MSQAAVRPIAEPVATKAVKSDPMLRTYDLLRRYVQAASGASRTISPDDQPFKQDRSNLDVYLYNGLSALRCMTHALIRSRASRLPPHGVRIR